MTSLKFRRRRSFCMLASTIAASSFSLGACASVQVSNQSANQQPEKVATAMITELDRPESDAAGASSYQQEPSAALRSTLTAQGFMDYLSDSQRTQLLGEGLTFRELTWAQHITCGKVLETLFNDAAYKGISPVLEYRDSSDDHILKFSAAPSSDNQWGLTLDGPVLGIEATFSPDGTISILSSHISLDGAERAAISDAQGGDVPLNEIHESALVLLNSLTAQQQTKLLVDADSTDPGLSGAELSAEQKNLLLQLASGWINLSDEASTNAKKNDIAATLDNTYFSWTDSDPLVFRISGPEVYVEYSEVPENTSGTSPAGTIVTVFKDPAARAAQALS